MLRLSAVSEFDKFLSWLIVRDGVNDAMQNIHLFYGCSDLYAFLLMFWADWTALGQTLGKLVWIWSNLVSSGKARLDLAAQLWMNRTPVFYFEILFLGVNVECWLRRPLENLIRCGWVRFEFRQSLSHLFALCFQARPIQLILLKFGPTLDGFCRIQWACQVLLLIVHSRVLRKALRVLVEVGRMVSDFAEFW